jgi:hypothetical protein
MIAMAVRDQHRLEPRVLVDQFRIEIREVRASPTPASISAADAASAIEVGVVAQPGHRARVVREQQDRLHSETIAKRDARRENCDRTGRGKSSGLPAMTTPLSVARQCWPRACEYSTFE